MKKNFNNLKFTASLVIAASMLITSCTKADYDDDVTKGDPPPVPGGFTNSSQVATANLLAYWNFDGDRKEAKSNTAPITELNTSFVTGIKGQALKFNAGYALYPTIAALSSANAISSCTVSMWLNYANTGSPMEFFSLSKTTAVQDDWGAILNVFSESNPSTSSNLRFKSVVGTYSTGSRRAGDNINDFGVVGVDYQLVPRANQWVHYIMRYDGVAETLDLYASNIRVSNNNFRVRGGLGPIVAATPTQVLLGGFPNSQTGFSLSGTQSWQSLYTGSMDEVRVYSKALSDVEISALFQLERQGR